MQPTHARWEACDTSYDLPLAGSVDEERRSDLKFPQIPLILERNFLVADTYFLSPQVTSFAIPGPDGDVLDVGPPRLAATSENDAASMPFDCRRALESAQREAMEWKSSWKGEGVDGARAQLRISYNQ